MQGGAVRPRHSCKRVPTPNTNKLDSSRVSEAGNNAAGGTGSTTSLADEVASRPSYSSVMATVPLIWSLDSAHSTKE